MALIPDVRIGWRGELVLISNPGFRESTADWTVGATSMHAAATSITRTTGDGVVGRAAGLARLEADGDINVCAQLVTTATSGSGASIALTGTAVSGRTYRAVVWLRRTAGTTSAKIILGSNGTPADRAQATMTLTGSWVRYSVDWTPSADRVDARLVIANNAASSGTFRISLPEVFEALTQVGAYGRDEVLAAGWTRGANFDGTTESPAAADLTLDNRSHIYDPDNGSSALAGLMTPGLPVSVRIIDTSVPKVYGAFYGYVRRFLPMPGDLQLQVIAEDPFYRWARTEVSLPPAIDRTVAAFRILVVGRIDLSAGAQPKWFNLDATGPEIDIPFTGATQRSGLGVLDDLNVATGSIHWLHPEPFLDVPWVYETMARTSLLGWSSAEHYDDTVAGATGIVDIAPYDITDEALVDSQRVTATIRALAATVEVVWEAESSVPMTIAADQSRQVTALIEGDPIADTNDFLVQVTQTGPGFVSTVDSEVYGTLVDIDLQESAGAASTVTSIRVRGRRLSPRATESISRGSGTYPAPSIETNFLPSIAAAEGLADWIIYRYASVKGRPGLTVENRTAAHVSRRVGEVITVTHGRASWTAKPFLIRTLRTDVSDGALVWRTSFTLEAAPATVSLFTIGGSAAQGVGGTGILAP